MTLNSRNNISWCVFILIHHSFGFPDMIQEGGQLTPLIRPCCMYRNRKKSIGMNNSQPYKNPMKVGSAPMIYVCMITMIVPTNGQPCFLLVFPPVQFGVKFIDKIIIVCEITITKQVGVIEQRKLVPRHYHD